jgi:hypothetical protein
MILVDESGDGMPAYHPVYLVEKFTLYLMPLNSQSGGYSGSTDSASPQYLFCHFKFHWLISVAGKMSRWKIRK